MQILPTHLFSIGWHDIKYEPVADGQPISGIISIWFLTIKLDLI